MEFNYDDIRYYNDEDFRKYLPVLLEEPIMYRVMAYFDPEKTTEEHRQFLAGFDNIRDFQLKFIIKLVEKIIKDSTTDITYDGLHHLTPGKKYLFLTNHRNIVMDVAQLNYILYKTQGADFESTAIAIGDNLLSIPWVRHLARMNKSFLVERGLNPQDMLRSSKRLSHYIRKNIKEELNSVWIANREGRTKDGNDFTQAGLIKMLLMSGEGLFSENIGELHVVPVAISYEKDPCIAMKVNELAIKETGKPYVKEPLEDFNSMYAGLMGDKGHVHYHFGPELSKEVLFRINENIPVNQKVKNIINHLDEFYFSSYRLYENNYIAADLLNGSHDFHHLYHLDSREAFIAEMNQILGELKGEPAQLKRIYLSMFANPVKNYYSKVDSDYKFTF